MKSFTLALALHFGAGYAQNLSWQWAKMAGGIYFDEVLSVACDKVEDVYITGTTSSPLLSIDTFNLINADSGIYDVFIARLDATGNIIWAIRAGGKGSDEGSAVCVSESRDIYVAGYFQSDSIVFGSNTLYNNNPSKRQLFVVKYDVDGNAIWARSNNGSNGHNELLSLTVDPEGFIYCTGYFEGSDFILGSDTLNNTSLTERDFLVLKMDSLGNVIWVRSAQGATRDFGSAIAVDVSGNVFAAGGFNSPSLTFDTIVVNRIGLFDIFIVKYDSVGNVLWVRSTGGSLNETLNSICLDDAGNAYIAGEFASNQITFGPFTLTNSGSDDCYFLMKYDTDGIEQWAVQASLASRSSVLSISSDPFSGIYATGTFMGSIAFGPNILTNTTNKYQIFISRFDKSNGNAMWGISMIPGSVPGHDIGTAIATNNEGYAFAGGVFRSSSLTLGSTTLINTVGGNTDAFIAKLDGNVGFDIRDDEGGCIVYPNPVTDMAYLSLEMDLSGAVVQVLNCFGQTVKFFQPGQGNTTVFSLAGLDNGMYFIRVVKGRQVSANCKVILSN